MMRLAFRGLTPRMLGTSGRRSRGGPTPSQPSYHNIGGVQAPPRDDLRISLSGIMSTVVKN